MGRDSIRSTARAGSKSTPKRACRAPCISPDAAFPSSPSSRRGASTTSGGATSPVSRTYWRVALEDGRVVDVYRDLISGKWWRQTY